jgi:hypothetical protein
LVCFWFVIVTVATAGFKNLSVNRETHGSRHTGVTVSVTMARELPGLG